MQLRPPRRCLRLLLRPWVQALILYLLTFGGLLPLLCHRRLHSRYFWREAHLRRLTAESLERSRAKGEEAVRYFQEEKDAEAREDDRGDRGLQLAIAIVTTVRTEGSEYHYYLQVASSFHRLARGCPWCRLLACNVHPRPQEHREALTASRLIPTVQRFGPEGEEEEEEGRREADNRFEKEKQDYLFCLRKALNIYQPRHVLLVEDDALPEEDVLEVLRDLLERRMASPALRDALYLKLYHPERLQGYLHPEPTRVLEWLGLGCLVGGPLSGLYQLGTGRHWARAFPPLAAFAMLAAELAGRHYLLELRRLSPQLYALAPASECCTPAMLYSAPSARRVLGYLGGVHCRQGYAKDTALYALLREKGERAWVLEPNAVTHIGVYSTLRGVIANPSLL
ncbi:transmembrane protein 246 [Heptranchias perlo]|uniref:transmembrane protein 246 n=1 Tax=Heptranchias perlo TaxID=212740 RepID=UPI00355A2CD4